MYFKFTQFLLLLILISSINCFLNVNVPIIPNRYLSRLYTVSSQLKESKVIVMTEQPIMIPMKELKEVEIENPFKSYWNPATKSIVYSNTIISIIAMLSSSFAYSSMKINVSIASGESYRLLSAIFIHETLKQLILNNVTITLIGKNVSII